MKIIINADDCGKSQIVNAEIEQCIINGKITSTTVMANMEDFDGAVRLYDTYNGSISFGWHINLTEGEPLTKSQILLDKGYYLENDGHVVFNGNAFWSKTLGQAISMEIKKELRTQYEKLMDNGICITHADSHQHIHTSPSMLFLIPGLLKELNITRCRRLRNYKESKKERLLRNAWALPFKLKGLKMTDTFASFSEYVTNVNLHHGDVIELMCHPGHPGQEYSDEYDVLKSFDLKKLNAELISYKEL